MNSPRDGCSTTGTVPLTQHRIREACFAIRPMSARQQSNDLEAFQTNYTNRRRVNWLWNSTFERSKRKGAEEFGHFREIKGRDNTRNKSRALGTCNKITVPHKGSLIILLGDNCIAEAVHNLEAANKMGMNDIAADHSIDSTHLVVKATLAFVFHQQFTLCDRTFLMSSNHVEWITRGGKHVDRKIRGESHIGHVTRGVRLEWVHYIPLLYLYLYPSLSCQFQSHFQPVTFVITDLLERMKYIIIRITITITRPTTASTTAPIWMVSDPPVIKINL